MRTWRRESIPQLGMLVALWQSITCAKPSGLLILPQTLRSSWSMGRSNYGPLVASMQRRAIFTHNYGGSVVWSPQVRRFQVNQNRPKHQRKFLVRNDALAVMSTFTTFDWGRLQFCSDLTMDIVISNPSHCVWGCLLPGRCSQVISCEYRNKRSGWGPQNTSDVVCIKFEFSSHLQLPLRGKKNGMPLVQSSGCMTRWEFLIDKDATLNATLIGLRWHPCQSLV